MLPEAQGDRLPWPTRGMTACSLVCHGRSWNHVPMVVSTDLKHCTPMERTYVRILFLEISLRYDVERWSSNPLVWSESYLPHEQKFSPGDPPNTDGRLALSVEWDASRRPLSEAFTALDMSEEKMTRVATHDTMDRLYNMYKSGFQLADAKDLLSETSRDDPEDA